MTTAATIIGDALRDINVISEVDPLSPEQGSHGLRKLNQMLEAGKESDIEFGWFSLTATTETVPIPDWAEIGVTAMLSIVLAPVYGASVSPELAAVASTFANTIKRKVQAEKGAEVIEGL